MRKFQVIVRYNVPAYAKLEVDAETQAEAEARVKRDVAGHGFCCSYLADVEFTADWRDASDPSVVKYAPEGLLDDGLETHDAD